MRRCSTWCMMTSTQHFLKAASVLRWTGSVCLLDFKKKKKVEGGALVSGQTSVSKTWPPSKTQLTCKYVNEQNTWSRHTTQPSCFNTTNEQLLSESPALNVIVGLEVCYQERSCGSVPAPPHTRLFCHGSNSRLIFSSSDWRISPSSSSSPSNVQPGLLHESQACFSLHTLHTLTRHHCVHVAWKTPDAKLQLAAAAWSDQRNLNQPELHPRFHCFTSPEPEKLCPRWHYSTAPTAAGLCSLCG